MPTGVSRDALIDELIALEDEVARRRLIAFTQRTFREFTPNWHHRVYARALERVLSGACRRLIVCMPPQNGKSELGSRQFPAWALGKDPSLRIVASSYGAALAHDMSNDVQRIMDSQAYRLIFPKTRLATGTDDESKTTRFFQVVGQRGYYVSAGVGGSIAGKTADIGIMDDPTKNREDAESEKHRKTVWDFFTSVFYNRQFGDTGRLVIITTRWHEDDLAGRLMSLMRNGGESWEVVSFPAVAELPKHPEDPRAVGDPLWPERYPLDELERRRRMSEYDWAALYQQRPAPVEGGLIKRAWWQYYDPTTVPRLSQIVLSLDPATKEKQTNDYWALGAWGLAGASIMGLASERGHWDTPACTQHILAMVEWCRARWPHVMPTVLVENTAAGPGVVSELKRKIPGVLSQDVKGDKVQRAHAILPALESKMVYLPGRCLPDGRYDTAAPWPTDAPISCAWVDSFIEECAAFPFGVHDDQVDQMTQALRRLYAPRTGYATANIPGL